MIERQQVVILAISLALACGMSITALGFGLGYQRYLAEGPYATCRTVGMEVVCPLETQPPCSRWAGTVC